MTHYYVFRGFAVVGLDDITRFTRKFKGLIKTASLSGAQICTMIELRNRRTLSELESVIDESGVITVAKDDYDLFLIEADSTWDVIHGGDVTGFVLIVGIDKQWERYESWVASHSYTKFCEFATREGFQVENITYERR